MFQGQQSDPYQISRRIFNAIGEYNKAQALKKLQILRRSQFVVVPCSTKQQQANGDSKETNVNQEVNQTNQIIKTILWLIYTIGEKGYLQGNLRKGL